MISSSQPKRPKVDIMSNNRRGMGRIPSGAWSRLKPVELDPLEAVGLPSKGDKKLLDKKAQEKYYTKIVERYISFLSDAGKREELMRRLAAFNASVTDPKSSSTQTGDEKRIVSGKDAEPVIQPSPEALADEANNKRLSTLIFALRKLREGIVATKRADEFANQVYLFNIRLAILSKLPESYHPACLHLLNVLNKWHPLTAVEEQEVASYLILDAACRRSDYHEAYSLRRQHKIKDVKIHRVLSSLVHDNWIMFREVRKDVSGYQARIMDFAADAVRMHTLKSFTRAYMTVDLPYLETATEKKWEELQKVDSVGWELEGQKVVIQRRTARPVPKK